MGIYLDSIATYSLYKSEVNSPYFVDKSQMLTELIPLAELGNRHVCVTRPRRFGKTVMANMIGAFFGKGVNTGEIFDTLNIAKYMDYKKSMNQYHVIYIDFSVVDDECNSYQVYSTLGFLPMILTERWSSITNWDLRRHLRQ